MKKIILFIAVYFCMVPQTFASTLTKNAKSSILIEESSKEIISKKNINKRLAPASMTKIMTLILIMEEIEKGNLKMNEEIRISKNSSGMGGSQIYLEENEKMTVEDLLKGIAIASANDAVIALSERISGSEEAFVFKMNEKAKKLKLKNTNFKNATGLDNKDHYSSAYDMAIMASELIKHKKILKYTSRYEDYLRNNSSKKFWLVNTNKLLKTFDGLDGLKTGYTKNAGYCLTATAKKNNMRLIGVVMGEDDSKIRNEEMRSLLNYGFSNYKINNLIKKNKSIEKYTNEKAKMSNIDIISKNDINILNKNNSKKRKVKYKIKLVNKKLPIKKGDIVAELYVYEKGKLLFKNDLTVNKNVKKANIFDLFIKNILKMVTGEFL